MWCPTDSSGSTEYPPIFGWDGPTPEVCERKKDGEPIDKLGSRSPPVRPTSLLHPLSTLPYEVCVRLSTHSTQPLLRTSSSSLASCRSTGHPCFSVSVVKGPWTHVAYLGTEWMSCTSGVPKSRDRVGPDLEVSIPEDVLESKSREPVSTRGKPWGVWRGGVTPGVENGSERYDETPTN